MLCIASCAFYLFASCTSSAPPRPWELESGWKLYIPAPFEVMEQSESSCFIADPQKLNARTPHTVFIYWPNQDTLSQNPGWQKLLSSGQSSIYYQEDRLSGGSGGDEFVFRAWKKVGDQLIYLEERYQSEWEDSPSFSLGKGIIRSVSSEKSRE